METFKNTLLGNSFDPNTVEEPIDKNKGVALVKRKK